MKPQSARAPASWLAPCRSATVGVRDSAILRTARTNSHPRHRRLRRGSQRHRAHAHPQSGGARRGRLLAKLTPTSCASPSCWLGMSTRGKLPDRRRHHRQPDEAYPRRRPQHARQGKSSLQPRRNIRHSRRLPARFQPHHHLHHPEALRRLSDSHPHACLQPLRPLPRRKAGSGSRRLEGPRGCPCPGRKVITTGTRPTPLTPLLRSEPPRQGTAVASQKRHNTRPRR